MKAFRSVVMLLGAAFSWAASAVDSGARDQWVGAIPPHRPLPLPGVHAYTDRQSVAAGQTISFLVSSTVPYRLTICRLGLQVDDPSGDEVLHEFPEAEPQHQAIHPGSYVHVDKGLQGEGPLPALSLECWVRPWRTGVWSGLLGQFDFTGPCGYGLFLNPDAGVSFYLGDGAGYREQWMHSSPKAQINPGKWHHVLATWDGREKTLWIDGQNIGRWPFDGPAAGGESPLRLAACGRQGMADHFLDGDLAMPAIYDHAQSPEWIAGQFRRQGLQPAAGKGTLARWTFAEERDDHVADISAHGRHGRIINHATWMIGGPSFQANVPRFGDYDPKKDARRGHGLRFATDDLYDCRWQVTHEYRVRASAKPGFYVGRVHYQLDGRPYLYHVTFIVKRAEARRKAPILLLASTNTWRAYNSAAFPRAVPGLKHVLGGGGMPNSIGNPPAYSCYRGHASGQGTYQLGLLTPWPAAGPYILGPFVLGPLYGRSDYSHLLRAERFVQVWLEQAGYEYDVVGDLDLHRDPSLLRGYQVLIINGHSEYWSLPAYDGLKSYLEAGGNVACLAGNVLCWRVSFNDEGTVMECRKVDAPGKQVPDSRRGECWHSQDGRKGGLLRECGYPGWKLVGLDILGWVTTQPDAYGPYEVERPDHFLFNRPNPLQLKKGDLIGQAPDGGMPRANGHEFDVRVSTLRALAEQPVPAGASHPNDPEGIVRIANGIAYGPTGKSGPAYDYFFRQIRQPTKQGGEMMYWERPSGGRVFHGAAIGFGWALSADPKLQGLMENVLFHFGVKR